jgi:cysteine desulfurase/selenocysteine lyase
VDGAQQAAHAAPDLKKLGADFYAFSGHKMLGPFGIGGFYAKVDLLEKFEPAHTGGGMISDLEGYHPTWQEIPEKWEPGTPNIAGAIGLAEAVRYQERLGIKEIEQHIAQLTQYAATQLRSVEGVEVYGPEDNAGGIIAFNVQGVHAHDVAEILNQYHVAIRVGRHCAFPLIKKLSVPAVCRASFHLYNTKEEVDKLVTAVKQVKNIFS